MAFFNDFTKKVTEKAKIVAKKSGDMVESTKISMNISSEEEKINRIYTQIGKEIYEAYASGSEVPDGVKEKCLEIKSIKEEIEKLKEKIAELKGIKYCVQCGEEMERTALFCSKCGAKNELPEPEQAKAESDAEQKPDADDQAEPAKPAVCPKCGAKLAEGAAFCSSCGTKVD